MRSQSETGSTYRLKSFGVLGGMGPGATAAFLTRFFLHLNRVSGATLNSEFPAVTVQTVPSADFISDPASTKFVSGEVKSAFDVFRFANVQFVVVPCNTAHLYLPIPEYNHVPILSLPKIIAECEQLRKKRVLMLATAETVRDGLYRPAFKSLSAGEVRPSDTDQDEIHSIIWSANSGVKPADRSLSERLLGVISKYEVEAVFLGCTELCLFGAEGIEDLGLDVLSSLDELVRKTVQICRHEEDLSRYQLLS